MRTDVKLGVVFALVMVLAAGGYFMFRGEKQTPISLDDKTAGTEIKTQPGKPGTVAKPGTNPPKTVTTNNNRPPINPRPLANNTGAAAKPAAPAVTPAMNRPVVPTPSTNTISDAAANPVAPRPTSPALLSASPGGPAATSPAVTTNANPTASPGVDRAVPAATSQTNGPAIPSTVADRPAAPATGREVGLTGIPNSASQPTNSGAAQPSGNLTPLSNSPSVSAPAPATMTGTSNALPPGIRPSEPAKPDSGSTTKKGGLADAAVETHKVQVGDSLSSLAQTYYGDSKYSKLLADANPKLGDPNRLKVGTSVSIPPLPADADSRTAGATTPASSKPGDKSAANGKRTYTVKAGDSFYSIAKSQLGSSSRWKELLALNNSVVNGDPTSLQPGQRIVLPESQ